MNKNIIETIYLLFNLNVYITSIPLAKYIDLLDMHEL